jgi:acylglycerol lipase
MYLSRKRFLSKTKLAIATLVGLTISTLVGPASAEVVRNDNPQIEGLSEIRVREWRDTDIKPKAVAIAVHGLVLHGGVYDKLARELASRGIVVIAPDLRGYGRWCPELKDSQYGKLDNATVTPVVTDGSKNAIQSSDGESSNLSSSGKISYEESYSDLKELVKGVRSQYSSLPLYVIGESLGAGMTLHLASDMPQSIDGIVLSSPAIKRRNYMEPRMVMDLTAMMLSPSKTVNVSPYIKRFASEDPLVAETALQDPLVRKKLKMTDLLKTSLLIRGNIKFASKIPAEMPVLIIQGDNDRMLNANGVVSLIGQLKSRDQTVRWFPGKGHLLLETPHIMPETIQTVSVWLTNHLEEASRTKETTMRDAETSFTGMN